MELETIGNLGIMAADMSFKVAKLMRVGSVKACKGVYTVMSGDGRLLGQWFLSGVSNAHLRPCLEQLKGRFRSYNQSVGLFYTDNTDAEKAMLAQVC